MANPQKYAIEHRSKAGVLKNRSENIVSDLSWEWNRIGGCGLCEFAINKTYSTYTIDADDDIQIWVDDTTAATGKLVYRGFITDWERNLEQGDSILISCNGYFEKLKRYVINASGSPKVYENMGVEAIATDIINSFVIPNSTPTIILGTVDSSYFSPDSIEFKGSAFDALQTLSQLLGNVEYGIDEDLTFFWRTESQTINSKFYLGSFISSFSSRTETEALINKIYFEGNTIGGVVFTTTGQSSDSQTAYGLREAIVSNSSINTTSTANQIISAILKANNRPKTKIRVAIHNQTKRFEDTLPLGAVQIMDNDTDQLSSIWGTAGAGGSDLTWGTATAGGSDKVWGTVAYYQIDRIKYVLSQTDGYFDYELELGGSRYDTPAVINQIETNLEAVRQRQI